MLDQDINFYLICLSIGLNILITCLLDTVYSQIIFMLISSGS